jgi:aryl-alcohol dehydrogenase-like predicted oxidoreductase
MNVRTLGRTGFKVTDIGYGLWGMSGWSGSDDDESRKSLQFAADLGCNFFDSAWAYGEGKSDGFLGELLRQNSGKRLYAASKIPPKNRRWPASPKDSYHDVFPPDHVFEYAGMIRKKLQVETIDLLQFHVWNDGWTDEKDFRETVTRLKREGVIRFFGLSLNRWEPENGIRALRTGLVDVVQVVYNVFDQNPEDELFPVCRELNIGVIARVPLDEGSLSGKLTAETSFPESDWRSRYFSAENLRNTLARVEQLQKLLSNSDGHSMTLPEMALRYILSHAAVSTTIVGMRRPEHVRQNLAASDASPLPPELLAKLKKHRWERRPQSHPVS